LQRPILVIVALLPILGRSAPAGAESYFWNAPEGGAFPSPLNWQPFDPDPPGIALGPGGVNDSIHFDLGVLPGDRYTVTQVSGVNHELLIHGDSLRLEFSGDYSLPDLEAGVPNFVVGVDGGDAADVVLTGHGGAVFQPLRTFIAATPGSSGAVTVTGSDWLWDVGHQLMVGWYGTGMLTIEDGADVISSVPLIGTFDDSIGAVSVRGAGSSWVASGGLSIAVSGSATLGIEDGASVTSGSGNIGNSAGSLGAVSVRGDRSRWDMGLDLFIGYNGAGELAIEDGGAVTGGDAWLGGWDDEGFGTATVGVRGPGSSWTLDGGLTVGVSNSATLTIEDGGSVSNVGGWIGLNPGSTGTAIVRGTRARWLNGGQLFVGDEGAGTLVVETGGRVASVDGWLGVHADAIGTVSVRDAGSSWDNGGLLFVGSQGAGVVDVEDGGSVSNGAVWMGLLFGSTGTVTVRGGGSTWDVAGALRVGYSGDGTLRIEAGGAVASASADIAATFGSTSSAIVSGAGSTWEHGELRVGSAGTGTLTIADGAVVASADGTIGDRGTVDVEGADSIWTISGSLEMEQEDQAGTLGIGISGPTQHGSVSVAGGVQLAGDLELALADGFVPEPEDSFTVLTSGAGIAGAFGNVANGQRVDTVDGLGSFLVHYGPASASDPDHIVLTAFAVPEPDALLMALAANAALLSLRRTSRRSVRSKRIHDPLAPQRARRGASLHASLHAEPQAPQQAAGSWGASASTL